MFQGTYRRPPEKHSDPGVDKTDKTLHEDPDWLHLWGVEHRTTGCGIAPCLVHTGRDYQGQDRSGNFIFFKCIK